MIYIFLPAYNEEKSIPALFANITRTCDSNKITFSIVIVDDGSTDATASLAEQYSHTMPVTVLKHTRNRGLGKAVQTGLSYIISKAGPDDLVVTMDADNTHDPHIMLSMIQKAEQYIDVVIASRYVPSGENRGVSLFRKILSRGSSFLLHVFFPYKHVTDYTSGYRLYRASILKKAYAHYGDTFITQHGFACMAEILINLMFISAAIREVPLVLRYDLKSSKSKIKIGQTIMQYIVFIIKTKLKRI